MDHRRFPQQQMTAGINVLGLWAINVKCIGEVIYAKPKKRPKIERKAEISLTRKLFELPDSICCLPFRLSFARTKIQRT